jgi:hypothetical protein
VNNQNQGGQGSLDDGNGVQSTFGPDLGGTGITNVEAESLSTIPNSLATEPQEGPLPAPRNIAGIWTKLLRRADLVVLALIIIGAATLVITTSNRDKANLKSNSGGVAGQYSTQQIPLSSFVVTNNGITFGASSVSINGSLKLNNGLVVTPTVQPSAPTAGQLYFDQNTNQLAYFNGAAFVPLSASGQVVQSIGGVTGALTLGGGLTVVGNQLSATQSGVTSFGGATGAVRVGGGLNMVGNALQNTGALSIVAGANISVANDGNGNYTINNTGGGTGTVTSSGGSTGVLPLFTSSQNIEDSLVSQSGTMVTITGDLNVVTGGLSLGNALTVGNGGTGTTSLAANGVVVANGTAPFTSVAAGSPGLCFISTAGMPTFAACPSSSGVSSLNGLTGALNLANASAAGSTVTIDNASTITKGIASFNSANFSASAGAINTIQDINTTATPVFARLTVTSAQPTNPMLLLNNTDVTASGNLIDLQQNGTSRFSVQPNGNTTVTGTINGQTISASANLTGTLNVAAATTLAGVLNVNGGSINSTAALNITPGGTLTVGTPGQTLALQGNASTTLAAVNGGNTTTLSFQAPTASVTYRLATTAAGNYDICTTAGNCVGAGGGVTSPGGTTNRLSKFTGATTVGDSTITDNGTTVTTSANIVIQGGTATIGVPNSQTGSLSLAYGSANFSGVATVGALTANRTYTLPDADGTVCLSSGNCLGGGGGGANTALSNLSSVAINTSLLPGGTSIDLGSGTAPFRNLYIAGSSLTPGTNNFQITGTATAGRTITLPDSSGTVCLNNSTNCGFLTGSGSAFVQNGNTLGAAANLGTNDGFDLNLRTGGTTRLTVQAGGDVSFSNNVLINGGQLGATGALAINPSGTLTAGTAGQTLTLQGNATTTVSATDSGNTTTVSFQVPTANVTYRFVTTATGSYDICTTAGNCVGTGGGVSTGGGTTGTIAVFTGAQTIGDSLLSQSGGTVSVNGNINLSSGSQYRINSSQISSANLSNDANLAKLNASQTFTGNTVAFKNGTDSTNAFNIQNAAGTRIFTIDTTGGQAVLGLANTLNGKLVFNNVTNGNKITIQTGTPSTDRTLTLPDADGVICTNSGNCAGVGATLQTGYDFSVGGTTPKIKVNSTLLGVDIQDADTTINANLFNVRGSNGAGLGQVLFGVGSDGKLTVQNVSNSTTALRFLTQGGTSVLTGDTQNGQIILGQGGTLGGTLVFNNATNSNQVTIVSAAVTGPQTITLPDATGTLCLSSGNCSGAGSSNTLQAAYDAGNSILTSSARDIAFTLADSATDANFLANLQCTTACGANGRFAIQNGGVDVFHILPNGGAALFKPTTDTTSAFNIQTSLGNNLFTIDALNARVGIGLGGSNLPSLTGKGIELSGALSLTGSSSVFDDYVTPSGSSVGSRINVVNADLAGSNQVIAVGVTSTSDVSARGISVFDARTVAHQPSIGVFSPDESNIVGFSWNGSNSLASVQTTDHTVGTSTQKIVLQSGNVSGGNGSSGDVQVNSGTIAGGTGGNTGSIYIVSGDGGGTNSSSGNVVLDSGVKTGLGTAGAINIGQINASAINLGRSAGGTNITTNIQGLAIVKPRSDTFGSLRVQDAAGNQIFGVGSNSTIMQMEIGKPNSYTGQIVFDGATGGNAITLIGQTNPGAARTITLPDETGTICLQTSSNCGFAIGTGSAFVQNGNTLGATAVLGTNDSNSLAFETNNVTQATIAVGGATIFKNSTDSAAAFQVQDAAAASLLTIDTSARSASGGNLIKVGNSTGTDGALTVLKLDSSTADPTSNLAALNGGLFYNSTTNKVSLIENGQVKIICNTTDLGCGTGTVTLQSAYNNAPTTQSELIVDASRGGLDIQDRSTSNGGSIAGNLLNIHATAANDTTAGTSLFSVNSTGLVAHKTTTDSVTAFTIQNSANAYVFDVDTTNKRVGIGTNAPSRTLDVSTNDSNTTSPAFRLLQAGSGDATLELNTPATSIFLGIDNSDGGSFKISSTAANGSTVTSGFTGTPISFDLGNQNMVSATQVTSGGSAGTLNTIKVYFQNASGNAQVALYADTGSNAPGALLATSAAQAVVEGWNTFAMPSTAISASTNYWIGFNVTAGGVQYGQVSSGRQAYQNVGATFGTWPSPFGTPSSSSTGTSYLVNMTYTPSGSVDAFNGKLFSLTATGQAAFKNYSDSTTAFQVQNSSSNAILTVKTSDSATSNVITNSGFEAGTTGWAKRNTPAKFTSVSSQHHSGNSALYVEGGGNSNDGAEYPIALVDNNYYTASFYIKFSTGDTTAATIVAGYSSDGVTDNTACNQNTPTINGTGWVRINCYFQTSATHSGTPYFYIKQTDASNRDMFIDDVILQQDVSNNPDPSNGSIDLQGPISSPLTVRTGTNTAAAFSVQNANGTSVLSIDAQDTTNIITNPSFEQSDAGWQSTAAISGFFEDPTQSLFGNWSLKVTANTTANVGAAFVLGNTAPTALATNTTYSLSWYAKLSSGTFTDIKGRYSRNGGTNFVECTPSSQTLSTSGWTRFSCSFTTDGTSPTSTADIRIVQTAGGTAHTFWIDGVRLEAGSTAMSYGAGRITLDGTVSTPASFRNGSDSTAAFNIQTASGVQLFNVDTLNKVVTVPGSGGTSSPFVSIDTVNNKLFVGSQSLCSGRFCVGTSLASAAGGTTYTNLNNVITADNTLGAASTMIGQDINITDTGSTFANTIRGIRIDTSSSTNTLDTINGFHEKLPSTTSNSQFAGNAIWIQNGAVDMFKFTNTGALSVQNTLDSTTAFKIQNSAGSNLLSVDSTNSNITLLGVNSPSLGAWNTNTNTLGLATPVYRAMSVTANGYIYYIGGSDGTQGTTPVVYAKVNSDGSTGTFTATTSLGLARESAGVTVMNGYIYIFGGLEGTGGGAVVSSRVTYARINSDGTLGSWSDTTSLPAARYRPSAAAANGYVYVVAGMVGAPTSNSTTSVSYAKTNADGTITSWTTSANTLGAAPANDRALGTAAIANGRLYYMGGQNDTPTNQTTVYVSLLNASTGANGAFSTTSSLATATRDGTSAIANGYIYYMGGCSVASSCTAGLPSQAVQYAKFNASTGVLGSWTSLSTSLPSGVSYGATSVMVNGYIYYLGGSTQTGTTNVNTVLYASTSRVQIGGSLDLVGVQGTTLADPGDQNAGSPGGSLTAGNGTFVGSLQVQGQATFNQTIAVNGNANFQNTTNSTSAFAVMNASTVPQFSIDTTNSRVYIGNPTADTTGAILVLDNKTGWTAGQTSDPTGVVGGMYYNSGSGAFRCYQVDRWSDCLVSARTSYHKVWELGALGSSSSDDFTGYTINSATFSQPAGETGHPGITQFNTITTSGYIYEGSQADNIIRLGNNDYWRTESEVRLPSTFSALSTATQRYIILSGFIQQSDSFVSGAPNNGCFFEYSDNINGGKWAGECIDNGVAATPCDTTIGAAMDTWYRLTVVLNAAGNQADFRINGVSKCTLSVDIPTASGHTVGFGTSLQKTVGATDRDLDVDYIEVEGQFGTPR